MRYIHIRFQATFTCRYQRMWQQSLSKWRYLCWCSKWIWLHMCRWLYRRWLWNRYCVLLMLRRAYVNQKFYYFMVMWHILSILQSEQENSFWCLKELTFFCTCHHFFHYIYSCYFKSYVFSFRSLIFMLSS